MAIDETELRTRMRKLVASGELLTDAVGRARRYLADADDRPVAPTAGAVAALERFSEPLPASVGDASEILAMLDEVGSPGTVAQTGARFVGLVNGGMIPTAHAARVLADACRCQRSSRSSDRPKRGDGGSVPVDVTTSRR